MAARAKSAWVMSCQWELRPAKRRHEGNSIPRKYRRNWVETLVHHAYSGTLKGCGLEEREGRRGGRLPTDWEDREIKSSRKALRHESQEPPPTSE